MTFNIKELRERALLLLKYDQEEFSNEYRKGLNDIFDELEVHEKTLAERESKYKIIVENQNDLVLKFDRNYCIHYANQKYLETFGVSEKEILGKSFIPFVHEKNREKVRDSIEKLLSPPYVNIHEEKARTVNGWRWFSWSNKAIIDQKGPVTEFIGVGRDITEAKEIELALKESEKKFRLLYNSTFESILIHKDGVILTVNDTWQKMFKCDEKDVIGKHVSIFTTENSKDISDRRLKDKPEKPDEMELIRCNGERFSAILNGRDILYRGQRCRLTSVNDVTIIKKAEIALKESEERYRSVISNSLEGIFVVRGDRTVFANPIIFQITGYSDEEVYNKNFIDFIYEQDRALIRRNNKLKLNGKKVNAFEYRIVKRSGELLWVRSNITIIDWEGEPAILYFASDINDMKITEEALIESEEKYKRLFEKATEPMLILENGIFIDCNRSTVKSLGYSGNKDIIGKKPHELSPDFQPDGKASFEKAAYLINETLKKGYIKFDWVHQHKDGHPIWFSISLTLIPESGNNRIHTVWRDISERIRMESELKKSEERLSLALKSANQGLYDLNVQTGEAVVNNEYATMLGYDPKYFEESNEKWFLRLHPDDKAEVRQKYQDYVGGKRKDYRVEFRQETKDGKWKWILSVGKIVEYDEQGKPLRMLGTHTDLSEIKEYEDRLKQQNDFIQTVLDNLPIGVALNEIDRPVVTYMNKKFGEIYGWPLNELRDRSGFLKKVYPDESYRNRIVKQMESDIDSGKPSRMRWKDIIVTGKNGEQKVVNTVNIPLFEQNTMVSTVIDVSEQKKFEEELRKNRDQLQGLFDHMNSGFAYHRIILDNDKVPIDYEYIEVNKTFEKMTRLKREEIIGKRVTQVLPGTELDRAGWIRKYAKVALTGKPVDFVDYSMALQKWFHINAYSPEPGYFATTFEDVTESKKAEKALKERDLHFTSLLSNPKGYIIYRIRYGGDTSKVKVTHISPSIFEIFGIKSEDAQNFDRLIDCIHKEDLPAFNEAYRKAMMPPFKLDEQFRVIHPLNGIRWMYMRSNGVPYLDDQSKIEYANGIILDITEQKNIEEQLKQHQEKLAELVKMRTAELEEKNRQLERMNDLFVGREFRIKELKLELKELTEKLRK